MNRVLRITSFAIAFFSAGAVAQASQPSDTPPQHVGESHILPISKVLKQGKTGLCSVFSTLSAIESNFLNGHLDKSMGLSRSALQYFNWQDRYERQINGIEDHLWEGSTTIDVIHLIQRFGLVEYEDYTPEPKVVPWLDPFLIDGLTVADRLSDLSTTLNRTFGPLPTFTHFDGRSFELSDFAKYVLGDDQQWEAYSPSEDGSEGYGPHWDPDARAGTLAWHLPRDRFISIIKQSLAAGHAVVVSIMGGPSPKDTGHSIEIYGADYGDDGAAITYYFKDSDDDGLFLKPADQVEPLIRGLTTVKVY
jgi:hypothetical protein